MKRLLKVILSVFTVMVLCFSTGGLPVHANDADGIPMWRLYNPNSGEHFYTADENERDVLYDKGWNIEGIGWVAPSGGDPVFRMYNPVGGDHHYTTSEKERDGLVKAGWKYEKVGWYSGGSVTLKREYNPNKFSCNHNYTTDTNEHNHLVAVGWTDEGDAWNALGKGSSEGQRIHQKASAPTNNTGAGAYAGPWVYTKYGKKFHRPDCPTVEGRIAGQFASRQDAINRGYEPCKVCNP